MKALVYRSTGSWYDVKDDEGRKWKARIRGAFKIDGLTSTNPIAVGDWVTIEPENEEGDIATITNIDERSNYISRQSPSHRKQHHIVASNIDQSLLICTLKDPKTSLGFIDRFLVASEAYHVPAILVFNKTDNWKDKQYAEFEDIKFMYQKIGYEVWAISAKEKTGFEVVEKGLANKTTLLSGHSGVGKSSFLNALVPAWNLRTKEVSGWSGKGMHTTTFAEMFELPFGGKIIDTPGVREFGIVDIPREELSHYYPEMRALLQSCQFNNCMHVNEPGCAVKNAVIMDGNLEAIDKGLPYVFPDRYFSYINILESIPEHDWK